MLIQNACRCHLQENPERRQDGGGFVNAGEYPMRRASVCFENSTCVGYAGVSAKHATRHVLLRPCRARSRHRFCPWTVRASRAVAPRPQGYGNASVDHERAPRNWDREPLPARRAFER